MAKTETTRQIERALRYYHPAETCGIRVNKFRGTHTAFEVPTICGTTAGGLVDCLRIQEYFGDIAHIHTCAAYGWKKANIRHFAAQCPHGYLDSEHPPELCDETSCRLNCIRERVTAKILITAYEIKITKSDFKSKNGHNFVGNCNYYVIPKELYEDVRELVPEDIGIHPIPSRWQLYRPASEEGMHLQAANRRGAEMACPIGDEAPRRHHLEGKGPGWPRGRPGTLVRKENMSEKYCGQTTSRRNSKSNGFEREGGIWNL